MPAIQPALLKRQAALVVDHFDNPAAFARSLGHLLDIYADRIQRPGLSGTPRTLLPTYRVRPPVIRQVLHELRERAEAQPAQALEICDQLWELPYLEDRLIAIGLLGMIPTKPADPIIERLERWRKSMNDLQLLERLYHQGLARLRQEQPQTVIDLVETWLSSPEQATQQAGLQALLPLAKEPAFTNLPIFFRILQPWVGTIPEPLRPDLLNLLESLIQRSPQETALFLRQALNLPTRATTAWVIRQVLLRFPEDSQKNLRMAMRTMQTTQNNL